MDTKKFTIDNPMPPLWMMHPHITRYSIGWRMGYGEGYKYDLNDWFDALSDEDQKKYQEMFPAPRTWAGHYDEIIDNDYEEDEGDFLTISSPFWHKNGEMQYSTKKLLAENRSFNSSDFIFFWKTDPKNITKGCFSQWQYSEFEVDIDDYTSAEQFMMAEKAQLFEDEEIRKQILETPDPMTIKALGRKVKNFDEKKWKRARYSIVLNGNYYKFSQNEAMRNFLLSTGDKILVEASPLDRIWGIGMGQDNENAPSPSKWKGENLLGFALMEVRDELRTVYKNYDKIDWDQFSNR